MNWLIGFFFFLNNSRREENWASEKEGAKASELAGEKKYILFNLIYMQNPGKLL